MMTLTLSLARALSFSTPVQSGISYAHSYHGTWLYRSASSVRRPASPGRQPASAGRRGTDEPPPLSVAHRSWQSVPFSSRGLQMQLLGELCRPPGSLYWIFGGVGQLWCLPVLKFQIVIQYGTSTDFKVNRQSSREAHCPLCGCACSLADVCTKMAIAALTSARFLC